MSLVTYNNICLPYPLHTSFRQDAIYDEVGQTDWYLTRYTIDVQCIINYAYLVSMSNNPALENAAAPGPADFMRNLRNTLMQPRKTLSVKFKGVEYIPQQNKPGANPPTLMPGTVDAKNGPQPQYCNYTQLTDQTFIMHYGIVAHYWETTTFPDGSPASPVLYNRWTESIETDAMDFPNRVREGRFAIRSDNRDGKFADFYRDKFAVLGVPQGWLRNSSSYTVSPDGLAISYRVSDRKVYKVPPVPSFRAEGTYTQSFDWFTQFITHDCNVVLWGGPNTPQVGDPGIGLLSTAAAICLRKVISGGVGLPAPGSFHSAWRATQGLYDNHVEFSLRSMSPVTTGSPGADGKQRVLDLAGFNSKFFAAEPYTDNQPVPYIPPYNDLSPQPTVGLSTIAGAVLNIARPPTMLLHAAAYWDPKLAQNLLELDRTKRQSKQGLEPGQAGLIKEP